MAFKDQINKLKDNWLLIALLIVVMAVMSGGLNLFSASLNYKMMDGGGYAETAAMAYDSVGVARSYYPGYNDDFAPEVEERVITKTSSLSTEIERGKYKSSEAVLRSIVGAADGFILNENVNQYDEGWKSYYSGYYTIKVPTDDYESVLSQLKEIGEVTSFSENADDVTGRYTDLNTQLETEMARLERYEQMYEDADDVEDKLELTDRIFNQERTIRYLEDAIDSIDKRVDYSQVYFRMNEKRSEYADIAFVKLSNLIKSFVNSTSSLLRFIFAVLPWAVAFLIVKFLWKLVNKR